MKADIYHIHDPELLLIALKLKKRNKKVIYDAHEDLPRQILTKHWIPKIIRKPIIYQISWVIYEAFALILFYKNKNQLNKLERI